MSGEQLEQLGLCIFAGIGGNPRPKVGALLGNRPCDGRALHFPLVVDNYSRAVFKVEEGSILSPECLPLSNDDCGHDLLSQLWLSLLHCGQHHVSTGGCRWSVEATSDSSNSHDEQVLASCAIPH